MTETPLSQAMNVLCEALREDPAYRETWKANLAISFFDAFNELQPNGLDIYQIKDRAAERFLNLLTAQV